MSFSFLHSLPPDICHVVGGLILVLDAGLLTLLLAHWKEAEAETPRRAARRPKSRSADDKVL